MSNCPTHYPCPKCGIKGKRKSRKTRIIIDIALHQTVEIVLTVGKYKSHCDCSTTYLSSVSIVDQHAKYSNTIRQLVADSLIRDRLPYRLVQDSFLEDFHLKLSLGYIHQCFYWAHSRIISTERLDWVLENFSAVLCIDEVHDSGRVLLDVNKLVLKAIRRIKNTIKRRGNKGRNKKCGRVKKSVIKQRKINNLKSNKAKASFLWNNQYLVVRKEESLSDDDRKNLKRMIQIAPEIEVIRNFTIDFYRIFEKGISPQQARYRRTLFVRKKQYQANKFLNKALNKLIKEKFEKMIVFLRYGEEAQRTSNHVERNNRAFRMMQKTRYKRRKSKTIIMALDLFLERKFRKHKLYNKGA